MKRSRLIIVGMTMGSSVLGSGCVVGQAPGKGRCVHLRESSTNAAYSLYLPLGYDQRTQTGTDQEKYPLVMSFHGMKPFDTSGSQIREWQQEADRYGFVVCAPKLDVSALLGPLPLSNPNNTSLKRDERAIVAIMDELYRTVDVDPNRVLSTSWSYGGYVAHYMANRYPERFSCVAVRQSNFNADLLDPSNVPRYRDHKIGIFFTENDFAICRRESRAAAEWYAQNGFDLTYAVFEKMGHERTPSVAAEFFARTIGVEPKSPPTELASLQVITLPASDYDSPGSSGNRFVPAAPGGPADPYTAEVAHSAADFTGSERIGESIGAASIPRIAVTPRGTTPDPLPPIQGASLRNQPVPDQKIADEKPSLTDARIRIRVSSSVGVSPMMVSYSALMPDHLTKGASLLWLDNGIPISNGLNGQKVFREPGDHTLEVQITTPDGSRYVTSRTLTVLRPGAEKGK